MHIVFTWEWGAGVSHLSRFRPLAEHLVSCGHRVTVLSREVKKASRLLHGVQLDLVAVADFGAVAMPTLRDPRTMGGFAWNLGFGDVAGLTRNVAWWAGQFERLRPDRVICDYGLAASATAQAIGIPVIRIGTGFECPPCSTPLKGVVHLDQRVSTAERAVERNVLACLNTALRSRRLPQFDSLGKAIGEEGSQLIATVPELDAYGAGLVGAGLVGATGASRECLGAWNAMKGISPVWPEGLGRRGPERGRVVAYLKASRSVSDLLGALDQAGVACALVSESVPERDFAGLGQVVRQSGFVDWNIASETTTFVVTNGNHGSTLAAVSRGIPVLVCPMWVEQRITAERIEAMGCGVVVDPSQEDTFAGAIESLMTKTTYRESAKAYRDQISEWLDGSLNRATEKLTELINR